MSSADDVQFLAKLVHCGQLEQEDAKQLLPRLQEGEALDSLLEEVLDWDVEEISRLRRTDAGEIPEIPGFEVLGKLGTGGTADVWRVREKRTGHTWALKVLKAASKGHQPTLKAFIAEAKMLKELSHKGLVGCKGVAKYELSSGSGKFAYFSKLECIEGATLQEILDKSRPFKESEAMQIILEVAEVLKYLASQKIVHRDVKPGNVMFTAERKVKLIDLGFAAEGGSTVSSEDTAAGTKEYLSPEQARGGASADERSDIYSLGVTLFQLVIGRLPFEQTDDQDLLRAHIMEQLSSPELKSQGFTPHLHYFIEKMMAKEIDVRYQGFEELMQDVKGQLAGYESLDFSRPSPKRPVRRPRKQ
jgi:serine/threonine-protein kinase